MKSFARVLLAATAGCLVGIWSGRQLAAQKHSPITITRLYAGPDGQSHAEQVELKLLPSAMRAGLEQSEPLKLPGAIIMRWPAGQVWEWHNASHRQYVVQLSGQGEVEVSGGKKIRINPGQIVMAEDLTGKGHITRSVGSEDLVLLIIPYATQ